MTATDRDDDRRRAEDLLVLRVNNRLTAEEAAELDRLLADHPDLAAEEDFLRAIKSEVEARDPGTSPGEFGLARLRRAIAEEEAPAPPEAQAPADDKVVPLRPAGRVWRITAIAASLMLAVQVAGMLSYPEEMLRLAGGGAEQRTGPVLVVAFQPDATEAEIRTLLVGAELTIIDGPSALGLYRLAARDDTHATQALAALQGAPEIESAERE